jgi:hypothetical protein
MSVEAAFSNAAFTRLKPALENAYSTLKLSMVHFQQIALYK